MKKVIEYCVMCMLFALGITACGGGGSSSSVIASNPTTTSTPDTAAPTAPTNLTTTPTGTNSISLKWSASTDSVGVAGYKIYKFGTAIASSLSSSFTNTNLDAGTNYCYEVSAYDAANNESVKSDLVCAATSTVSTDSCWSTTTVDGGGFVDQVGTAIAIVKDGYPVIVYGTSATDNNSDTNIYSAYYTGGKWNKSHNSQNMGNSYPAIVPYETRHRLVEMMRLMLLRSASLLVQASGRLFFWQIFLEVKCAVENA